MGVSQSKKMDELIAAVQNMSVEVSMPNVSKQSSPLKLSKPVKYLLIAFVAWVLLFFLGSVIFDIKYFSIVWF